MSKVIATIVTAVAALFMFAGVASADVISQSTSEESHQKTSRGGTSNAAEDHMAGATNDGNTEGDTPKSVLVAKRIYLFNADGSPVLDGNGLHAYTIDWRSAPIGSGVAPATIVHN